MRAKPITGHRVFAVTAGAFAVVIAVNAFMAWSAVRTFPGLEVKNSYVASRTFDADRAAQEALGWDVSARLEGRTLALSVLRDDGSPAPVRSLSALLGRPTHSQDDISPAFVRTGGVWRATVDLEPGGWALRLRAEAENGAEYRKRLALYVKAN